ncbi:gas vesicle protein K [Actinomadura alba]|uniref:gas vesicle protein K n=1 Tax=Actinomadura alba TaxID=406431 RepID=UPI0028A909CE|nr:gas vesicle protein K [Actinomadura alba]
MSSPRPRRGAAGPRRAPEGDPRAPGGEARRLSRRLETDPEAVERDLVRLVLTIVELVRQLMERQALRRVDAGNLSDEQVERVGLALMRLEEAMNGLQERFDIDRRELNIDLGPLGPLLPPE